MNWYHPIDLVMWMRVSVVVHIQSSKFISIQISPSSPISSTILYRRNFRFMSRLRLNTIISLTPEPPTSDLLWFSEMATIKVMHSPVNRLCAINEQLQHVLINALNVSPLINNSYIRWWVVWLWWTWQICIDVKNHPVYIHCLDGRRITSLLVLLLRRSGITI